MQGMQWTEGIWRIGSDDSPIVDSEEVFAGRRVDYNEWTEGEQRSSISPSASVA